MGQPVPINTSTTTVQVPSGRYIRTRLEHLESLESTILGNARSKMDAITIHDEVHDRGHMIAVLPWMMKKSYGLAFAYPRFSRNQESLLKDG